MGYWIVDGRNLTDEEYEELQRQKKLENQRIQAESQRLTRQLGEAYATLKEHLRATHGADQQITDDRVLDRQIFHNLWHNLEKANEAPRCAAIKADGTSCGSPKMKSHIYCYAHWQMTEMRAQAFRLPALEDANAIQMAVMRVQQALIDDEISEKKAGLLFYSIQIAAANVHKTTFGQAADEDMVTETAFETETMKAHTESKEWGRKLDEIKGKFLPSASDGKDLPRADAELRQACGGAGERELEPLIQSSGTEGDELGKMLPQPADAGGARQSYANLG